MIIEYAWKFAEEYRQCAELDSVKAGSKLRHPSVIVCEDNHLFSALRKLEQPGMYFLNEINPNPIRSLKTEIQKNNAGLNLKRVNISLVAFPSEIQKKAAADSESAGQLLRTLFEEDFPIVNMSLFILISENNNQENFEARTAASLRLIQCKSDKVDFNQNCYNMRWLLSDRNEHDIVKDENMQNNLVIITTLQSLTGLNFEESLRQKYMDRPVFATAGMAKLTKPHKEIAFSIFRRVVYNTVKKVKSLGKTPQQAINFLELPVIAAAAGIPAGKDQLVSDMKSIAMNKISGRALHKKSLLEVERLLYGDRVKLFFEANKKITQPDLDAVMLNVKEQIARQGPVAAEVYRFPEHIKVLEERIKVYTAEIDLRYQELYNHKLFSKMEKALDMIADIYVLRSQAARLQRLHDIITELYDTKLWDFCGICAQFVQTLEKAKELLEAEEIPGLHISEYYDPIVDRIMEESDPYSAFFTGIQAEPEAIYAKLAEYIEKNIMTNFAMQLSFEEDQKARAALSPDSYDRDFAGESEFYSSLLKEADRQAALAISLNRYDDLVSQKYYLGDMSGPCMAYARDHAQKGVNEPVYFIEDTSGFSLLRVSGGFVPEDLARYRTMLDYAAR